MAMGINGLSLNDGRSFFSAYSQRTHLEGETDRVPFFFFLLHLILNTQNRERGRIELNLSR